MSSQRLNASPARAETRNEGYQRLAQRLLDVGYTDGTARYVKPQSQVGDDFDPRNEKLEDYGVCLVNHARREYYRWSEANDLWWAAVIERFEGKPLPPFKSHEQQIPGYSSDVLMPLDHSQLSVSEGCSGNGVRVRHEQAADARHIEPGETGRVKRKRFGPPEPSRVKNYELPQEPPHESERPSTRKRVDSASHGTEISKLYDVDSNLDVKSELNTIRQFTAPQDVPPLDAQRTSDFVFTRATDSTKSLPSQSHIDDCKIGVDLKSSCRLIHEDLAITTVAAQQKVIHCLIEFFRDLHALEGGTQTDSLIEQNIKLRGEEIHSILKHAGHNEWSVEQLMQLTLTRVGADQTNESVFGVKRPGLQVIRFNKACNNLAEATRNKRREERSGYGTAARDTLPRRLAAAIMKARRNQYGIVETSNPKPQTSTASLRDLRPKVQQLSPKKKTSNNSLDGNSVDSARPPSIYTANSFLLTPQTTLPQSSYHLHPTLNQHNPACVVLGAAPTSNETTSMMYPPLSNEAPIVQPNGSTKSFDPSLTSLLGREILSTTAYKMQSSMFSHP